MPALAIWSPEDEVLGAVAPLALGAAAGTALIVDLDVDGPMYPGDLTLAGLVADGPTKADLSPKRRGIAVVRNGGVDPEDAEFVLRALVDGWPAVVFRLPADHIGGDGAIPVLPLIPGSMMDRSAGPAIYQRSGWRVRVPEGGIVLPRPGRGTVSALLTGRVPHPGDRWIRAWRRVWEQSWV
ncbi:MAG: hypothetical protein M3096_04145 [Actinomycetia bacterium]|nr:hypothetical protein [Actinomycetes bacterium]